MKLLITFCILFSFQSYGARHPFYKKAAEMKLKRQAERPTTKTTELKDLRKGLQKDMKKLLSTLMHEKTPETEKIGIIKMLSEAALLNNEVTEALKELISRGSVCQDKDKEEGCRMVNIVSLRAHKKLAGF